MNHPKKLKLIDFPDGRHGYNAFPNTLSVASYHAKFCLGSSEIFHPQLQSQIFT